MGTRLLIGILGAGCVIIGATPLQALASPAYYELDDLGPLGGDVEYLNSFVSGNGANQIRCRIGSVNGINAAGQVVATRIDAQGNPYVTVDNDILPTNFPPSIGCAISDDGFVVGRNGLGAAIWHSPYGTFEPYPMAVVPPHAVDSILLSVTSIAQIQDGAFFDLGVAGMFLTSTGHLRSYQGNFYPDLSFIFPELSYLAVPNAVTWRDSQVLLGGFYRQSPSSPFYALQAGMIPATGENDLWLGSGVVNAMNQQGVKVGCTSTGSNRGPFIRDGRKGDPDGRPDACLYAVNNHEIGGGSYLESGEPSGLLLAPDGVEYPFGTLHEGIPLVDEGPAGWRIESIHGLNDEGVIAANASVVVNGVRERHAVRLRPVVIPNSITVDGDFETHPSLDGPFLRTNRFFNVTVRFNRKIPTNAEPTRDYVGRFFLGGFETLPSNQDEIINMFYLEREVLPRPKRVEFSYELNGVHASTVEWFVPDIEQDCSDGVDEDLDGTIDCGDPECHGKTCYHHTRQFGTCESLACVAVEWECDDGIDNDDDQLTDCEDSDCLNRYCGGGQYCLAGSGGVKCRPPPHEYHCTNLSIFDGEVCAWNCQNGRDDDGDALVDCADPDCIGQRCGDPDGDSVCGGGGCFETNCKNGIDDDGDKQTDCEDRDCDGQDCSPFKGGEAICVGNRCKEMNCCNGIDDNNNKLTDCEDPDCAGVVCESKEFGVCVCDHEAATCVDCQDCGSIHCNGQSCGGGLGKCIKDRCMIR